MLREVVGINKRNLDMVMALNSTKAIRQANDKLATKAALRTYGVPLAATYAVIRDRVDLKHIDWARWSDGYAIKPNQGAGGTGILVVGGVRNGRIDSPSGRQLSHGELTFHVLDVMDGGITGRPDTVFVEEKLTCRSAFPAWNPKGLPDIRVLICEGRTIMAMLRLPTKASGGRANLHQGAVGIGVDLGTGVTTGGVLSGRPCDTHPDTGLPLAGVQLPQWRHVLDVAAAAGLASGLGYTGIDVAIDDRLGPVVLEVNARPGLAIQMANRKGLRATG